MRTAEQDRRTGTEKAGPQNRDVDEKSKNLEV